MIWQISNDNFDLRDLAFEQIEVSEETPCVISFPNVNPYTLAVGRTVRMQVEGISQGSGITSVSINDSTGEEIFSKEYSNPEDDIVEVFEFTPEETKSYDLIGTLSEGTYKTACVISSPYDVKGVRAVANNQAPEFLSSPIDSQPSQDIDTGVHYEYTLKATDPEGDFINYVYSFTPKNQWLKYTVIKDGSNGELEIQFKGSTTKPASYLANVFIHDGYSKHLRSQSWIISVSPSENDIPKVIILSPWESTKVQQGDPLTIKWGATDRNAITHYELYMTQSLQDEDAWYIVDKDIEYNIQEYTFNTKEFSAGHYKAVIKATDNQDSPLVGRGISPQIEIIGEEIDMPDDKVDLPEPQIINYSPSGEEDITNPLITIRASLLASEDSEIDEASIVIKVDGRDVTSLAKFNKISESEYTIIYQTEEEYVSGLHRVDMSFKDRQGLGAQKSWTFNIETDEQDPDKFYIFGYGISKMILYVTAGGLLLILLSLIVPLILVRVWKEDETTVEDDESITPPPTTNTVKNLVNPVGYNEMTFSTLPKKDEERSLMPQKEKAGGEIKQKIIEAKKQREERDNSTAETVPNSTVQNTDVPEPDEDLLLLYQKINKVDDGQEGSEE
jgi:hypothetical protein